MYRGQEDSSCLLLGLLPSKLHIEKPAPPKAALDFVVTPITHPSLHEHIPNEGTSLTLVPQKLFLLTVSKQSPGQAPVTAPGFPMHVLMAIPTRLLLTHPCPVFSAAMSFR